MKNDNTELKEIVVPRVMKKFVTARGKAYYTYMAVLQKHLADDLAKLVAERREERENRKLSFADMCHILVAVQFPANRMKSLIEILENLKLINRIPHERFKHLGVRDSLIKLGYEKCPNPDCWRWYTCYCPECEKSEAE